MQICPHCHHIFSSASLAQCCGQSIDQQISLESSLQQCKIVDCHSNQCKNPFHFPIPEPTIPPRENPFFSSCLPFPASSMDHFSNSDTLSSVPTPHVSGHMFHFPTVNNELPPIVGVPSTSSCQISCRLNCLTHGGQLFCNQTTPNFQAVQPLVGNQKPVETKLTLHIPNIEANHRMQICCHRLEESGWYWKKCSWQEAMVLLKPAKVGTFIIRDSSDPKHKFSLSVQTERGPTSVRVHYMDGKFRLDCEASVQSTLPVFLCVIKMVQYYIGINEQIGNNVWVDNNGRIYSPIAIKKPLRTIPQTLKHLCRLAVNYTYEKKTVRLKLPLTLLQFLEEYPYWC